MRGSGRYGDTAFLTSIVSPLCAALPPSHPSPYPPCPPSRWEVGFGVPPAFTHTSFIGLQGGSRASLEMTIRRKRHSPPISAPSSGGVDERSEGSFLHGGMHHTGASTETMPWCCLSLLSLAPRLSVCQKDFSTSLEMTIRRKRHSPIPAPSFERDTRILSCIPPVPYPALRATFPTRGRQAIRGYQSPATSH